MPASVGSSVASTRRTSAVAPNPCSPPPTWPTRSATPPAASPTAASAPFISSPDGSGSSNALTNVPDGGGAQEPIASEGRAGAVRRHPLLLLPDQRVGAGAQRGRLRGQ